jgi:Family of unknown function (DUF6328)
MRPSDRAGMGTWESPDPRDESAAQRADRNLGELLQELRVAGLGVQVLFGFLLSLPFTTRFTRLSLPRTAWRVLLVSAWPGGAFPP